jgi:hypothetical protein
LPETVEAFAHVAGIEAQPTLLSTLKLYFKSVPLLGELTPCLRHTSATFIPVSVSLRIATIWLSVYWLFFIVSFAF